MTGIPGSIQATLPEPAASAEEVCLVAALRAGDETAFAALIDQYHGPLLRLALVYVPDRAAAEETVQDTWMGVLRGLNSFEGRSSLKTWIYRILVNRARTRGERESRHVTFSALGGDGPEEPAVDPDRFFPAGHRIEGHWASKPESWGGSPEDRLLARETRDLIQAEIGRLPPQQREVITLRDVEGWRSDEVCNLLGVSEANQRVLLHRARSKVRQALESYLSAA